MIASSIAMERKRVLVMAVGLFSFLPMVIKQSLVADIRFPDNAVLRVASMEVNETISSNSSLGNNRPYLILHLGPKKVKENLCHCF
jgi:hypothetical protein